MQTTTRVVGYTTVHNHRQADDFGALLGPLEGAGLGRATTPASPLPRLKPRSSDITRLANRTDELIGQTFLKKNGTPLLIPPELTTVGVMVRQIFPISALLLGSALLLFAGGVHGLILPVRGSAEGFTAASLGLLGTGWAVGYVAGCLVAPRLVGTVGHIRTFGVMCAIAAVTILLQSLFVDMWVWVPTRALSGFCFAGAAMIVESWLNDRAQPSTRGSIFGLYTMVNLAAVTAGQMAVSLGDATGFVFFAIGAMVYCLALVPTAISTSPSPAPLTSVRLDMRALWNNSPVAVVAVFFVGISNAAFGTLAAVYADRVGLAITGIALFVSIPVLAGALAQVPIGYASDRMDRRKVLIVTVILALIAEIAFITMAPETRSVNLALVGLFGVAIFAMYPVIVAHANDHAPPGTSIQVSGGLLMVFGIGSIIGPLVAGIWMTEVGPRGLFLTTASAHVLMIAFTLWRIRRKQALPVEEKSAFQISLPARGATPETAALSAGDDEALPLSFPDVAKSTAVSDDPAADDEYRGGEASSSTDKTDRNE